MSSVLPNGNPRTLYMLSNWLRATIVGPMTEYVHADYFCWRKSSHHTETINLLTTQRSPSDVAQTF